MNRVKSNDSFIHYHKGDGTNIVDAAAKGASQAIMLVLNIAASIIAFMAFVAFLDGIVGKSSFAIFTQLENQPKLTCPTGWFGSLAGVEVYDILTGTDGPLTLKV